MKQKLDTKTLKTVSGGNGWGGGWGWGGHHGGDHGRNHSGKRC